MQPARSEPFFQARAPMKRIEMRESKTRMTTVNSRRVMPDVRFMLWVLVSFIVCWFTVCWFIACCCVLIVVFVTRPSRPSGRGQNSSGCSQHCDDLFQGPDQRFSNLVVKRQGQLALVFGDADAAERAFGYRKSENSDTRRLGSGNSGFMDHKSSFL